MKKLIFILLFFAILWGVSKYFFQEKEKPKTTSNTQSSRSQNSESGENNIAQVPLRSSIFVPYWGINSDLNETYDRLIYFGISATRNGIDTADPGYKNLNSFVEKYSAEEKYLTLRLLDTDDNLRILEDKNLQDKIIRETIRVAQENGFNGIVMDLELSVLPFSNVKNDISDFVDNFGKKVAETKLKSAFAIYGDVFFRARPFDMKAIGGDVDEIMVMTYDFHKSYGEPGPTFPFTNKEEYGYDFQTMIDDFVDVVPREKVTIILGMFGYDWALGPEDKPLRRGEAITTAQGEQRFMHSCSFDQCKVNRNTESGEVQVIFRDEDGNKHEVWFEDEQSIEKKVNYLRQQGIGEVSYWAAGYF